jgi:hypothetical protein
MKQTTATRSAAGVSKPDHPATTDTTANTTTVTAYTRTSEQARALGFTLHATEIEGAPGFLVSRWGMSRALPDLAAVDTFLRRAGAGERAPAAPAEGGE